MHADSKFGMIAIHGKTRIKCAPICQQGSAGYQSAPVSIRDAPVDTFGPTQVVGIDDQILQLTPIPVLSDSYSFVFTAIFVPLTLFLSNSSMAIKRKNDGKAPRTQRGRGALRRKAPRPPHEFARAHSPGMGRRSRQAQDR